MMKLAQRYRDRDAAEWPPLFHRILQSQIADWHRRNAVRTRWRVWFGNNDDQGASLEERTPSPNPGPENQTAIDQTMNALDLALRALPPRQQQAFLLRIWEGLDVRETAAVMGCSEGSVKTHYSRAVHRLREKLGEHYS